MPATTATFFITTARAGTQWLSDSFRRVYSDVLVTEHEPIRYAYRPKRYLRAYDQLEELRALPAVRDHLDRIHGILDARSYAEVGFPCYAMAPLLVREFGSRLRLVQLLRHPVRVAASVVTHRWYQAERKDSLHADVTPAPTDPGVVQKDYEDRWRDLSSFEKGLFYWTEVHLFGLEVQDRYPDVPFFTVKFEDIVDPPAALRDLVGFLGLDFRTELQEGVSDRVDRYRQRTPLAIDPTEIHRHPRTLALAEQFGYDPTSVDGAFLHERYGVEPQMSLLHRAVRKLQRALPRGSESSRGQPGARSRGPGD